MKTCNCKSKDSYTWRPDKTDLAEESRRDRYGWEGYGDVGYYGGWGYSVLTESYSDPVIAKVPATVFGLPKWGKAEYKNEMNLLETIYKRRSKYTK